MEGGHILSERIKSAKETAKRPVDGNIEIECCMIDYR